MNCELNEFFLQPSAGSRLLSRLQRTARGRCDYHLRDALQLHRITSAKCIWGKRCHVENTEKEFFSFNGQSCRKYNMESVSKSQCGVQIGCHLNQNDFRIKSNTQPTHFGWECRNLWNLWKPLLMISHLNLIKTTPSMQNLQVANGVAIKNIC